MPIDEEEVASMRIIFLLAFAVLATAQTPKKAPTPTGTNQPKFRGFVLNGKPEEQPDFTSCREQTCYAEAWDLDGARVSPRFYFVEERLMQINGIFVSERFEGLKSILITKYGRPSGIENTNVQNGLGAKFVQQTVRWTGTSLSIYLRRYTDSREMGELEVLYKPYEDRKALEAAKNRRAAVKSL